MKALDKYILMVLFVLLLKRVRFGKWFEPRGISYRFSVIVQVRVVFRKTVVGDWCFDYLSGSHLQSQVKSGRQMMVFIFLQTKPKGVTTHMKALDEYILMVLFVLLLKRVHFLASETQECDHSNENSRWEHNILFVLLMKSSVSC